MTMLDPITALGLILQVSVTLIGFAGMIATINLKHWDEIQSTWLVFFFSTAFGALFQGSVPMVFLYAEFSPPLLWSACSAIWLLMTFITGWKTQRVIQKIEKNNRKFTNRRLKVLIVGSMWLMGLLQLYNLSVLHAFWPVLAAIMWMCGLSCLSFTAMLYTSIHNHKPTSSAAQHSNTNPFQ